METTSGGRRETEEEMSNQICWPMVDDGDAFRAKMRERAGEAVRGNLDTVGLADKWNGNPFLYLTESQRILAEAVWQLQYMSYHQTWGLVWDVDSEEPKDTLQLARNAFDMIAKHLPAGLRQKIVDGLKAKYTAEVAAQDAKRPTSDFFEQHENEGTGEKA